MKIVGLTGGIGSGKTLVSNIFMKLGIPVYNSDTKARHLINTDPGIKIKLINHFGNNIYTSGELNRKKLAEIIFNNKTKLAIVNNIVHPVVKNDFREWLSIQKSHYIIKEAAILFESGTYKDMDHIITVTAPEEIKIKRIISRDKLSKKEILKRVSNQLTDQEKIKKSDFVIYNDNIRLIIPQIIEINNILRK